VGKRRCGTNALKEVGLSIVHKSSPSSTAGSDSVSLERVVCAANTFTVNTALVEDELHVCADLTRLEFE
jgi:hypothetical protein